MEKERFEELFQSKIALVEERDELVIQIEEERKRSGGWGWRGGGGRERAIIGKSVRIREVSSFHGYRGISCVSFCLLPLCMYREQEEDASTQNVFEGYRDYRRSSVASRASGKYSGTSEQGTLWAISFVPCREVVYISEGPLSEVPLYTS